MKLVVLVAIFLASINWSFQSFQDGLTIQKSGIGGRIVGGMAAYPAQYPFMAAINMQTSNSRIFCIGALISNLYILTAGHCVNGSILFTIQLGSNSLTAQDPNRVTLASSSYVLHPEFNPNTNEHDLGLIRLRMPVVFTDFIKASDFLPTDHILEYQNVVAIGWGQLSDSNPVLSDELNWVLMSAIPNSECRLTYGNQITDYMVCASGNYNEGPCLGDSGGPLIHLDNDSRMTIVAVHSFISSNGCESTDPSGYTRTFSYIDWIRNTTGIYN